MSVCDPKRNQAGQVLVGEGTSVSVYNCYEGRKKNLMINTIGYWLSGVIALGIVLIGVRFFLAPHAAAAAFEVPVRPDAQWEAYLSVKAIRDIASGLLTAVIILNRSAHLLGWFMLIATIIPLTDAAIVLR